MTRLAYLSSPLCTNLLRTAMLLLAMSLNDVVSAQPVQFADLKAALIRFCRSIDEEHVNDLKLTEHLQPAGPALAERYKDARISVFSDAFNDSLPDTPEFNISVFLRTDTSLSAELWKVGFDRTNGQWHAIWFESLLQANIGDRFVPVEHEVYYFDELRIVRDSMEAVIVDGHLIPAFAGGEVGRVAIFGAGQFTFSPHGPTEQHQLRKFARIDGTVFTRKFTQMALLISPAGYKDLITSAKLRKVKNGGLFKRARKLLERVEKDYSLAVKPTGDKWSFLPYSRDFLKAEFDTGSSRNWLVYSFDPTQREQVSLVQKSGFPRNFKLKAPVVWNQFRAIPDVSDSASVEESTRGPISVERYSIEGTLEKNRKSLHLRTTIYFTAHTDSVTLLSFALNDGLAVNRVEYADGQNGMAIHQGNFLSIPLLRPLTKGEQSSLTLHYGGDAVRHSSTSGFSPLRNEDWIPMYTTADGFDFDLELTTPREIQHITTGIRTSDNEYGELRVSRWATDRPINTIGMIFTDHRTISANIERPELTVYADRDLLSSASRETEIAETVEHVIPYYEDLFGPFPFRKLDIVQMSDSYQLGQGLPSMLLLWGLYFRKDFILDRALPMSKYFNIQRFFKGFLAHELAHQWWGGIVKPRSYRDAWLSEGIATYSADLYIEETEGRDRFLDMLRSHMEQALPVDKEGAITLGPRLREAYQPLVYEKAAMVLHMLKQITGDANFLVILKSFYEGSMHKAVTTDDFRRITESVIQEDMSWFFDQWINGAGHPSFRADYNSREGRQGNRVVQGTLSQQQEGPVFRVQVPLRFELLNGEVEEIVVWSDRRSIRFELPVGAEVRRLVVAPDFSVYCEIE
ncbi:MAG: hypothetical protein HOH43_16385 [Candidatus Latescibacteria bacterium]|nr:hypothetical protein [Candidatus Latescibacterota bacterium]